MNKLATVLILVIAVPLLFVTCTRDDPPFVIDDSYRGNLVSYEKINTYDVDQVDSLIDAIGIGVAGIVGLDIYKVIYETPNQFGEPTIASGAVVMPTGYPDPMPTGIYMHGTTLERESVPSRESGEIAIGIILGSNGYMVCLPDYIGMGDGPGRHPYMLEKPAATCGVDIIRAARHLATELEASLNGQNFVFGYSQGGHAAMALAKEMELFHAEEMELTASAPMSGPYDIDDSQVDFMVADIAYPAPFYVPYVMFGYNEVYNLYDDPSEYLLEPWATTLPPMFDGFTSADDVNAMMPDTPKLIVKPEVLDAFTNNADHPFRLALEDNNTIDDWTPQHPMRMYYCTADDQVNSQSSIVAFDEFTARGATDVAKVDGETITGGPTDHGGCVVPVLLLAQGWFETLRE